MLISENGQVLLTDFGLSFLTSSSFDLSTQKKGGGTLHWMAPEVIYSNLAEVSAASDVWSFAMTMLVGFDHLYCEIN